MRLSLWLDHYVSDYEPDDRDNAGCPDKHDRGIVLSSSFHRVHPLSLLVTISGSLQSYPAPATVGYPGSSQTLGRRRNIDTSSNRERRYHGTRKLIRCARPVDMRMSRSWTVLKS